MISVKDADELIHVKLYIQVWDFPEPFKANSLGRESVPDRRYWPVFPPEGNP